MDEKQRRCELSCRGRKRELVEEEEGLDEEEVDDSYDSKESHYAYDSDDSDFELIDGTKLDPKVWDQYYRELDESEGFDISVYPGASFNSSIVPLKSYLTDPKKKQKHTNLCSLAIEDFNSQSAKKYEFMEIVTVNASFAGGMWFYFTFQARDTDDTTKIFQALVWDEIGGTPSVEFCRLKKGDGVPSHSSVDAEAAQ
ncbi:PREDICTED: uncharacterized protein LOC109235787 [Nicotiana attenuata]|uniref:Cystatin domain-containing protein n=1 Tax=Nicotiana attenuata TaxID=49451 RepID=A0A1J6IMZ9_NICAT|nr:PREDICTED: uncharacterized protein LOC109235787 [Nicotiana attenuata]OIS96512.1 hypothetical protein A4A49_16776 [Nicotiana attenuata]